MAFTRRCSSFSSMERRLFPSIPVAVYSNNLRLLRDVVIIFNNAFHQRRNYFRKRTNPTNTDTHTHYTLPRCNIIQRQCKVLFTSSVVTMATACTYIIDNKRMRWTWLLIKTMSKPMSAAICKANDASVLKSHFCCTSFFLFASICITLISPYELVTDFWNKRVL